MAVKFQEKYFQAVFDHNPDGATFVIDQALKMGVPIKEIYSRVILQTQKQVGDLWEQGVLGIADEH